MASDSPSVSPIAEAPEATMCDLADTSPADDCWRDVLDVRTINALLNHVLSGDRTMRRFFAMSDRELLSIRNMGRRGVERIRRAQRRVQGAPVAEWDADALASMLVAFAEDHPFRRVREAMEEAASRLRAPASLAQRSDDRPSVLSEEERERIAEIRARIDAATPGPWRSVDLRHQQKGQIRITSEARGQFGFLANVMAGHECATGNAALIESAPSDLDFALALLSRLTSGGSDDRQSGGTALAHDRIVSVIALTGRLEDAVAGMRWPDVRRLTTSLIHVAKEARRALERPLATELGRSDARIAPARTPHPSSPGFLPSAYADEPATRRRSAGEEAE